MFGLGNTKKKIEAAMEAVRAGCNETVKNAEATSKTIDGMAKDIRRKATALVVLDSIKTVGVVVTAVATTMLCFKK